MIVGVGVDIVENDRIRRVYEKFGNKFLRKILTDGEIEYCLKHRDPIPHVAARFAAKEAIIKALGGKALFRQIEIISCSGETPKAQILGKEELRVLLSLSHEKNLSIAFAVLVSDLIN